MADEIATQANTTDPAATPAPATVTTPPAQALNSDPSQDAHMIPKARFDEVNTELKRLKAESDKAAKERAAAEKKAAEEQGEYKKLYEQAQAEREKAIGEANQLRLEALRQKVAATVGLPPALASRLIGETEEDITADAKTLLATLPTPQAPSLNGGAGGGDRRPSGAVMTDAERVEFAALYNLDPRYIN